MYLNKIQFYKTLKWAKVSNIGLDWAAIYSRQLKNNLTFLLHLIFSILLHIYFVKWKILSIFKIGLKIWSNKNMSRCLALEHCACTNVGISCSSRKYFSNFIIYIVVTQLIARLPARSEVTNSMLIRARPVSGMTHRISLLSKVKDCSETHWYHRLTQDQRWNMFS